MPDEKSYAEPKERQEIRTTSLEEDATSKNNPDVRAVRGVDDLEMEILKEEAEILNKMF